MCGAAEQEIKQEDNAKGGESGERQVNCEPDLPDESHQAAEVPEGQREQLPHQAHQAAETERSLKYVVYKTFKSS